MSRGDLPGYPRPSPLGVLVFSFEMEYFCTVSEILSFMYTSPALIAPLSTVPAAVGGEAAVADGGGGEH